MAVGKRGEYLVIDFRCYLPSGKKVRCIEYEGKADRKNRKRVQSKWKAMKIQRLTLAKSKELL